MPNNLSTTIIILSLLVIVGLGCVLLIIISLTRGRNKNLDQEWYRTAWLKLENSINKNNPSSYQFAILSADKLLDKALKDSGVEGNSMGDRLKKSTKRFQDVNKVWAAHKLRNKIAHEVDNNISVTVSKQMLRIYKKALKDLGAI